MRLVPRVSAAELAAEVELARLKGANEIADLIAENYPGTKLGRVALNAENGRLAQINFETADKTPMAAIADITGTLTAEAVLYRGDPLARKTRPAKEEARQRDLDHLRKAAGEKCPKAACSAHRPLEEQNRRSSR